MALTKISCVLYSMDDRILLFRTCKDPTIWTPSIRVYVDKDIDDSQIAATMKEALSKTISLDIDPIKFMDKYHSNTHREVLFISKFTKKFHITTKAYLDVWPLAFNEIKTKAYASPLAFTYDTKDTLKHIGGGK